MAKRLQLENQTRDVLHLQTDEVGAAYFVLGDKADAELPKGRERDKILQPSPVVVLDQADLAKWTPQARAVLEDQIAQGRIRRTELA